MKKLEDFSPKEGEIITDNVADRLFLGSNAYSEFAKWVLFAKPRDMSVKTGTLGKEFGIHVQYLKEG
jgi:hypothetical protein